MLHISVMVMNRLNTTESAIFIFFFFFLVYSLLSKDITIQDLLSTEMCIFNITSVQVY